MDQIEQLKKALEFADERDMVCECVEVLRDTLPDLLEAVEALEKLTSSIRYTPLGQCQLVALCNADLALNKLKGTEE